MGRSQGYLADKKQHEQVSDAYIEQMLVGLQAWVEASNANSLVPATSQPYPYRISASQPLSLSGPDRLPPPTGVPRS